MKRVQPHPPVPELDAAISTPSLQQCSTRGRVAVPRVIACRRYRMISHMTEFPKKNEK